MEFLSFSTGAMGLDLGFEQAGFTARFACENDDACQKTIKHNRPHLPVGDNILDINEKNFLKKISEEGNCIDIVAGGPPCQTFSTAGKRLGVSDNRGGLLLTYINLAIKISPTYIVLENVRGILSTYIPSKANAKEINIVHYITEVLEGRGYLVSYNLYNTANYGVPQKRERFILIATKKGNNPVPFITPTHNETGTDGLQPWVTTKQVLENLTEIGPYSSIPPKYVPYLAMLKEGQNWRDLPATLQKEALGENFTPLRVGGVAC